MKKQAFRAAALLCALAFAFAAHAEGAAGPSGGDGTAASAAASAAASTPAVDEAKLLLEARPGTTAAPASSAPAAGGPASGAATATVDAAYLAPRSSIWDLIQMVLVLVFVILVIYFVFRLVKKGARAKEAPAGDLVTVVSSTPLASNRYLHLVKVGPRVLLVGSSESSIGLVAEVEDKETLDAAAIEAEAARGAPRKDFGTMLGQLLGGQKHPKNQANPMDFIKRQRDRLKRFK